MPEGYALHWLNRSGRDWITVLTDDERALQALRIIQGAAGGHNCVLLPATRLNFLAVEAIAAPSEVSEDYRAQRYRHVVNREGMQEVASVFTAIGELTFMHALMPHQQDFLAFAGSRRVVYNASEQGTGKTRMALGASMLWGAKRTLVIAPKEVADEWELSLECLRNPPAFLNLCEGTVTARVRRMARTVDSGTLAVVNYDVLPEMREALAKWRPDLIVTDESWKIKTPSAQRTRAALWISSRPGVGPFRLCLAGTPIGNHAGDLYPQIRFLDKSFAPETYRQWLNRYSVMESLQVQGRVIQKPVGLRDPVGLMARLEPFWFRATKEGCLRLPPKQRRIVRVPLTAEQSQIYREVMADGDAALGNLMALTSPAVKALRLQQIAGGFQPVPRIFNIDNEDEVELAAWQTAIPLACRKADWLKEWARLHLEPHPEVRALVFCRFSSEVNRVYQILRSIIGDRVTGITGTGGPFPVSGEQLTRAKREFNSRSPEQTQVLVCQVQKMSAGHNLQAADHVIYWSNSWSLIHRVQSEDRAHRQGREDIVQYWDLVSQGTVDEEVLESLNAKRDFSARVCRSTTGLAI